MSEKQNLIDATFEMIRNSEELGQDSCSAYDECYTDEELKKDIQEYIEEFDATCPEQIFNFYVRLEGIRNERDIEMGW